MRNVGNVGVEDNNHPEKLGEEIITYLNQRESSGTTNEVSVMEMEEQPQVINLNSNFYKKIFYSKSYFQLNNR